MSDRPSSIIILLKRNIDNIIVSVCINCDWVSNYCRDTYSVGAKLHLEFIHKSKTTTYRSTMKIQSAANPALRQGSNIEWDTFSGSYEEEFRTVPVRMKMGKHFGDNMVKKQQLKKVIGLPLTDVPEVQNSYEVLSDDEETLDANDTVTLSTIFKKGKKKKKRLGFNEIGRAHV